ncbi:MAG TPA: hypothetical protein VF503_28725 [Sphingobium sp.]|uniref:hypothetical protein n=1 Tax=Sphingobium sp. TaxID=1912891 RepID=UPI002ED4B28E
MSHETRAARAAKSELQLDECRFLQLTQDLKKAYEQIDGALAQTLRLNADMVDTAQEIGLEPEIGQKLFLDLTDCIGTMVDTRQKMVAVHTRATAIRMRTSQAARADGCWPPIGASEEAPTLRSVA